MKTIDGMTVLDSEDFDEKKTEELKVKLIAENNTEYGTR